MAWRSVFSITPGKRRQIGHRREVGFDLRIQFYRVSRRLAQWTPRQMLRERDRWVLWTPVGFGVGIGIYFELPVEPGVWVGPALLGCLVAGLIILKVRASATWPLILMIVLVAGFSAAQFRTALVPDHMLQRPIAGMVTRTVEAVEERPSRPRLIVGEGRLETARGSEILSKVRISLPPGTPLPSIGAVVEVRASLRPPPAPSTPGAYDFQRAAFFKELSAVGYGIGQITPLAAGSSTVGAENVERSSLSLWLAGYRLDLSRRIREALPGPSGALASALLTGERGPLPEELLRVMRESGLAHLLAISGLHM
jgi:competence protein ComEC